MRTISVLGIKNHRSAAVRGGARRVRPPLDPLVVEAATVAAASHVNLYPSTTLCVVSFSHEVFTSMLVHVLVIGRHVEDW